MQIHQLQRATSLKKKRYVGRGGKRGTTAGRGTKGQKARAGHKIRPELRDIIKKLPKRRGYGKNRAQTVNAARLRPVVINLMDLAKSFPDGGVLNPQILREAGLISGKKQDLRPIKILATGAVSQKLIISDCLVSTAARSKIEQAGGEVK